jgi:hypothetical protein
MTILRPTSTATSPFNHHQSSLSPRTPHSPLIIVWAHPSNILSPFWSPSFWPQALHATFSYHLSQIPLSYQRNRARPSRICLLERLFVRQTWQHYTSKCTHAPERLDSRLPDHAPRTGHSIEETREASTPLRSPHHTRGQRKAERPDVCS